MLSLFHEDRVIFYDGNFIFKMVNPSMMRLKKNNFRTNNSIKINDLLESRKISQYISLNT